MAGRGPRGMPNKAPRLGTLPDGDDDKAKRKRLQKVEPSSKAGKRSTRDEFCFFSHMPEGRR